MMEYKGVISLSAKNTSTTGLKKETTAALSYLLGPITGILFLVVDKNPYVQFHAMQSTVVLGGLVVLQWILALTVILAFLVPIITIVIFILWLVLIYKAWQGDKWEVPVLGKYSTKMLKKL